MIKNSPNMHENDEVGKKFGWPGDIFWKFLKWGEGVIKIKITIITNYYKNANYNKHKYR